MTDEELDIMEVQAKHYKTCAEAFMGTSIGLEDMVIALVPEIRKLKGQLAEAMKVIDWYGSPELWTEEFCGGPRLVFSGLEGEGFEKAREFLEKWKGGN